MKMQRIEKKVYDDFEKELKKLITQGKKQIRNSGKPKTEWMRKVTEKIKISDLAAREGIDKCPFCVKYFVSFDDSRGWFCCQDIKCEFRGNIVDFLVKLEEVRGW